MTHTEDIQKKLRNICRDLAGAMAIVDKSAKELVTVSNQLLAVVKHSDDETVPKPVDRANLFIRIVAFFRCHPEETFSEGDVAKVFESYVPSYVKGCLRSATRKGLLRKDYLERYSCVVEQGEVNGANQF